MQTVTILTTALLLFIQLQSISAIDLKNAVESSCFPIKETVSLDENFIAAHKTWYYPIMSRFDLYYTSVLLTGKENDLHEDELYYDGCMSTTFDENGYDISGFQGQRKQIQVVPVEGSESQIVKGFIDGKLAGTMYNTLTDNKSFIVTVSCTVDDEMTWGVISPFKKLPAQTVKLIHDHVQSLGFNRDYFTGMRYDHCEKEYEKPKVAEYVPNIITVNF